MAGWEVQMSEMPGPNIWANCSWEEPGAGVHPRFPWRSRNGRTWKKKASGYLECSRRLLFRKHLFRKFGHTSESVWPCPTLQPCLRNLALGTSNTPVARLYQLQRSSTLQRRGNSWWSVSQLPSSQPGSGCHVVAWRGSTGTTWPCRGATVI